MWKVPKIWEGGDVWIIGGGPSITRQFQIPEEVVKRVFDKEETPAIYSSYLSFLHDKHVIGVNMAYQLGTWVDMIAFGDSGFFLKNKDQLALFPGLKITCHSKWPGVKYLKKSKTPRVGISIDPTQVCWNENSGAMAINVAVHTGAKRIFLLGFDMKKTEGDQHWHKLYVVADSIKVNRNKRKKRTILNPPFGIHLPCFPIIAKHAEQIGIEIINVTDDSAIDSFKKITWKELEQQLS